MFVPIGEDVPSYFIPMMNDRDRNDAYESAIRETIASFRSERGRAPHVLDLGSGSGLLATMCLHHGADRVTLCEANETLCAVAEEQFMTGPYDASRWHIAHTLSLMLETEEQFDMVVCELAGSMLNSESMSIYISDVIRRGLIRDWDGHLYCVPREGEMTLRAYEAPTLASAVNTGIEYAKMNVLRDAVFDSSATKKVGWCHDEAMKLSAAAAPRKPLCDPEVVLRERYDVHGDGVTHPRCVCIRVPAECVEDAILLLEWKLRLSESVTLHHTLEHIQTLPGDVQLARYFMWGFIFAPLRSVSNDDKDVGGAYTFKVDWLASDLELTSTSSYKDGTVTVTQEEMEAAENTAADTESDEDYTESDEDDTASDEDDMED